MLKPIHFLGIESGRELVAGDHEPPLVDPTDNEPDALIDVISGKADPNSFTPEQKVAHLAAFIAHTTKIGTAHESAEVMSRINQLADDPEIQVLFEQYRGLVFTPTDELR